MTGFYMTEEEFNECEERERQIHEERVKEHYEHKCENCKHYNHRYPPPFCLICKTGLNDDFRKRDYWEKLTY